MTTTILNPTYDTNLQSDAATTNHNVKVDAYSGESNGVSGRIWRWMAKFDFSGIPVNAIVSSAILELYQTNNYSDNARTKYVYRVKRNWVYDQVTWNIYSTGNSWQTAGCGGADDRETTDIGLLALSATESNGAWYAWSLTPSAVQEWISGAFANNGLILITATETNDLYAYESLENAGGHDPKLTIVYTIPSGGTQCIIV